jgi:hypothetical protein
VASRALHGGASEEADAEVDYSLGFDPDAHILLANDSWKPVNRLVIGDVLMGKNTVLGIVEEECSQVCLVNNTLRVSAAQLVFQDKYWRRAHHVFPREEPDIPLVMRQVVTAYAGPLCLRKNGITVWLRDYREAPVPDMEDVYAASVQK